MRSINSSCVLAAFISLGFVGFITHSARADLVLFDNGVGFDGCTTTNCRSFTDLGAQGFGSFPRLLTLQTNTYEQGQAAPDGSGGTTYPTFPNAGAPTLTGTNDAIQSGNNKASSPTLAGLGWTSASNVAIGFNSDQSSTGITLQTLSLSLFNGTTRLGTFSIAGPI